MSPREPGAGSGPPDPLARRAVPVSGPHVGRILLVAGGLVAVGLAAYMAGSDDASDPVRWIERPEFARPGPDLPAYDDLAATPAPPEPRFERPEPKAEPAPALRAGPRRDALLDRAMDAGVGGWSRRADEQGAAADGADPPDLAAGGCVVPPGTPIEAQTVNRVVSEQGGLVSATVTRDVWGAGFGCLAVPAGSTVTLEYRAGVARGRRRIEVANPVITRPWPRADRIAVQAMVGDRTGAAGLPGEVRVPWLATGLLVAASTAVDLGVAALTDGASLVGALLGRNADRPLDRAARDALEQGAVVTLAPGEPVVLLLGAALATDDFRAPGRGP